MEETKLETLEPKDMTPEQAAQTIEFLQKAAENYEQQINSMNNTINEYKEVYNKDTRKLAGIISKLADRNKTKEDAMLKILEGMQGLFLLDRIDIVEEEK